MMAHHSSAVRKLDMVGAVSWYTVKGQQGKEQRAEHTTLWGPCLQHDDLADVTTDPHILWPTRFVLAAGV